MITPNKVITLRESALGVTPIILRQKSLESNLTGLYEKISKEFESIDQFLLALDVLYVLGKIDIDLSSGAVIYVD